MFEDDKKNDIDHQGDGKGPENPGKIGKRHAIGILGMLVLLLVKFKSAIMLALPFLKVGIIFAKLGKFAGTFISMLLTVLLYMQVYGLPFAVGFVLLIFFHEMGHSLMAKQEGLDVSTPMFIPFVGAFIRMKELPKSARMEARIAMGGPVLGSLASLLCLWADCGAGSRHGIDLPRDSLVIREERKVVKGAISDTSAPTFETLPVPCSEMH